jgi:peptidyl-prolyl cis-trans isomerase SurA
MQIRRMRKNVPSKPTNLLRKARISENWQKKYSNMPSAADGGDIGVFKEDDMAADMRAAVVHLKPGEISTIIETQAGYQFFKLTANNEGVDPQSSYESAKNGIRDTLYRQQLKEEFDKWVKNLKEQAYIRKM